MTSETKPVPSLPTRSALRVVQLNTGSLFEAGWAQWRHEIVAWLDRLAPDVVCMQEVQERGDGANSAGWSDGLHRLVQVQAINSAIAGDGGLELTQDWSDNELAADLNLHRKRIDYVFVSDQFMRAGDAGRVLHAEVVCDRPLTGVAASDHRGVLVDIAWPDRAEIGNQ